MTAPLKGESPLGAGLTREQGKADDLHSAKVPGAAHALRVIEGERKVHEYLARLQAQQAALVDSVRRLAARPVMPSGDTRLAQMPGRVVPVVMSEPGIDIADEDLDSRERQLLDVLHLHARNRPGAA